MEQQNQQSIPEKIESKPPIKTNWKYVAIMVVLGFVAVVGIFLLRTMGPAPSPTPSPTDNIQTLQGMLKFTSLEGGCWYLEVRIPPADPVRGFPGLMKYELQGFSENQLEQYRDQQVEVRGRIREDMSSICQIGTIFEVRKIYSTAENESNQQSTIETSDWQTYRNEEFGFEVRYPEELETLETVEVISDVNGISFWFLDHNRVRFANYEFFARKEDSCKPSTANTEATQFAGVPFTKGVHMLSDVLENPDEDGVVGVQYITNRRGVCYQLNYWERIQNGIRFSPYKVSEMKQLIEQFNQILSTFRFVP